ncbi:MAG: hypothetical protein ACREH4_13915, partial [Vitreimonas sp.]
AFVERVAAPPDAANQLARWDREVCTSVVGLPARQGQFLADRIAQRAFALGLQPGAPGCQGNVAVFVTADSDAMARRLFEEDPNLFAYRSENNVATLGQGAFEQFLNSDRPVRWWHVANAVSADGTTLAGDASAGGIANAAVARSRGSRLANDTRQDLARVIIIVDASRVGGAQLSALADYVSMVALAQVDPWADTASYPTILNLFSANAPGGATVSAMSDWDLAYLDGLYSATRHAVSAQQQEREIARRMLARGGRG